MRRGIGCLCGETEYQHYDTIMLRGENVMVCGGNERGGWDGGCWFLSGYVH